MHLSSIKLKVLTLFSDKQNLIEMKRIDVIIRGMIHRSILVVYLLVQVFPSMNEAATSSASPMTGKCISNFILQFCDTKSSCMGPISTWQNVVKLCFGRDERMDQDEFAWSWNEAYRRNTVTHSVQDLRAWVSFLPFLNLVWVIQYVIRRIIFSVILRPVIEVSEMLVKVRLDSVFTSLHQTVSPWVFRWLLASSTVLFQGGIYNHWLF